MTEFKRMAVFVKRDRFNVNAREIDVDAPRITRTIGSGLAEGIVVIDFIQGRVQLIVSIDVGRETCSGIDKDECDGES